MLLLVPLLLLLLLLLQQQQEVEVGVKATAKENSSSWRCQSP